MKSSKVAYFDYAAATPTDHRVVEAMNPYWGVDGIFGNPSSVQHSHGMQAAKAVSLARRQVARLIGAKQSEIIWTSGATEANNLAIKGFIRQLKQTEKRLITTETEHAAVLDVARSIRSEGVDVVILLVNSKGLIDLDKLAKAIVANKTLVSIMWVNNETGVIQPISKIAQICTKNKATLHVDGAQAVGKVKIDLAKISIDMLSMSAHKAYAPKGVGALYLRTKTQLAPLLNGGGHEKGIRPGTLAVPLIVGMGKAFAILNNEQVKITKEISKLQKQVIKIANNISNVKINGDLSNQVPHILNIRFENLNQPLISLLPNISASSGASCSTVKVMSSHVLRAIGLNKGQAESSLRLSFGRYTNQEDIAILSKDLKNAVPQKQASKKKK